MKVCILGPVSPYRSGIARHTTALAREIGRRKDVLLSVVSFRRQYPRLLYPGESDRDPGAGPPEGIDVAFRLDTVNPLTWYATASGILRDRPALVVIPAWTFFVAPALGTVAGVLRRHGVRIALVVHNAEDHEAVWWKRALTQRLLVQADCLITHNEALAASLAHLAPGRRVCVVPHPVYDDYPAAFGHLRREAALELLFFGLVRRYKGLDIALRGLAEARRPDIRLSIVGEFWDSREETDALIADLNLGKQVEIVDRYVSDQEAAEHFARCDAVVAPYRSATGSGVLALAQGYDRPVVASDVPGLAEAVEDGRTGWLFRAGAPSALAETLRTRVSRDSAVAMAPALRAAREARSWSRFADEVLTVAEQ